MFYNRFTAVALAGLARAFSALAVVVCCRFKNHAQRLYTRRKKKTRARIRKGSQTRKKEKAGINPALLFN